MNQKLAIFDVGLRVASPKLILEKVSYLHSSMFNSVIPMECPSNTHTHTHIYIYIPFFHSIDAY